MSLLACKPLYSVITSKKAIISGGVSSPADSVPSSSILKLEFSSETLIDTSRILAVRRSQAASLGFASEVITFGGNSFGIPLFSAEHYELDTEVASASTLELSLPRTYLSSASNSTVGILVGGSYGTPLGVIEHYSNIDHTVTPSNHLARAKVGQTTTSNSYEALTVGFNDSIESYNYFTKSIYNKFNSKVQLVGQSSASSTDIALFSGGQVSYPLSYQYRIRYSDLVELATSHLSLPRVGGASLSNNAVSYIVTGTATGNIDKFNFFDSSTTTTSVLPIVRYFAGYASNCHGGSVQ